MCKQKVGVPTKGDWIGRQFQQPELQESGHVLSTEKFPKLGE